MKINTLAVKIGKVIRFHSLLQNHVQSVFGGGKNMKRICRAILFCALCMGISLYGFSPGMGSMAAVCDEVINNDDLKNSVKDLIPVIQVFALVKIEPACFSEPATLRLPIRSRDDDGVFQMKNVTLMPNLLLPSGEIDTYQGTVEGTERSAVAVRITPSSICGSVFILDEKEWSFVEPLHDLLSLAISISDGPGTLLSGTTVGPEEQVTPKPLTGKALLDSIPENTYIVYNISDLSFSIDMPEVGHVEPATQGIAIMGNRPDVDHNLKVEFLADDFFVEDFEERDIDWKGRMLCTLNNVDLVYNKIRMLNNRSATEINLVVSKLEKLLQEPEETGYFRTTSGTNFYPNEYPGKIIVIGGPKPLVFPGSEAIEQDEEAVIPIYLDTSGIARGTKITGFNFSVALYPAHEAQSVATVVKATYGDNVCSISESRGCVFDGVDRSKISIRASGLSLIVADDILELAKVYYKGNALGSNAVSVEVGCPQLVLGSSCDGRRSIMSNTGLVELDIAQSAPALSRAEREKIYGAAYADTMEIRPYGTLMVVGKGRLPIDPKATTSPSVRLSPIVSKANKAAIVKMGMPSAQPQPVLTFGIVQIPGDPVNYKVRASLLWTEVAEFKDVTYFGLPFHRHDEYDCNKAPASVLASPIIKRFAEAQHGLDDCQKNLQLLAELGKEISLQNCGSTCRREEVESEPIDLSYVEFEASNLLFPPRLFDCIVFCPEDPDTPLAQLSLLGKHRGSSLVLIETHYVNPLNLICNSVTAIKSSGSALDGVDLVHFLTGRDMVKMSHTEMGDVLTGFPARNVDFVGIADGIGGYRNPESSCPKVDFKAGETNMLKNPARHSLTQHTANINALGSSYLPLLAIEVLLTSHEIAHNIGASHDSGEDTIMSSTLTEKVAPLFSDQSDLDFKNCIEGIPCPTSR